MSQFGGLQMSLSRFLPGRKPDIQALTQARDIKGLIALLDHHHFDTQWRAARALGMMGEEATPLLIDALAHPDINIRLGAIEALGAIRDVRSLGPLASLLASDESSELRWASALALGEIGNRDTIPHLTRALLDDDRYVRYGAAKALEQLSWQPQTEAERAYYLLALQDWEGIKKLGRSTIEPLIHHLQEKNPSIRGKIIDLLGDVSRVQARKVCERVLRDPDESVRWRAVLASQKCGIPITHLPMELSKRQKSVPSAMGSALLNFFFLGLGYNYIGRWWGFLVFMSYMTLITLAQLDLGPFMPFLIAYPVTALFATQTYFMVKRESEMTG
jgi:hypothetical protein